MRSHDRYWGAFQNGRYANSREELCLPRRSSGVAKKGPDYSDPFCDPKGSKKAPNSNASFQMPSQLGVSLGVRTAGTSLSGIRLTYRYLPATPKFERQHTAKVSSIAWAAASGFQSVSQPFRIRTTVGECGADLPHLYSFGVNHAAQRLR